MAADQLDFAKLEGDPDGGGDDMRFGDIFTEDQFPSEIFDDFLSNPPFGVDWKKQQKEIQREHEKRGFDGRFGAGSPMFTWGAGSGESEVRRWRDVLFAA